LIPISEDYLRFHKDSEKYYETAFKREQKSAELYIKVGDIINNATQSNTALKYYNLAQEIEPDNLFPPMIFNFSTIKKSLKVF
jgi:disulfide oxidoreductase YuzD